MNFVFFLKIMLSSIVSLVGLFTLANTVFREDTEPEALKIVLGTCVMGSFVGIFVGLFGMIWNL